MAGWAFDDRWALVAVVVTDEAADLLRARLTLGAVVVTPKALDRRDTRQWFGTVIIAALGLLALGKAPFEAEDFLPIDRVGLGAYAETANDNC